MEKSESTKLTLCQEKRKYYTSQRMKIHDLFIKLNGLVLSIISLLSVLKKETNVIIFTVVMLMGLLMINVIYLNLVYSTYKRTILSYEGKEFFVYKKLSNFWSKCNYFITLLLPVVFIWIYLNLIIICFLKWIDFQNSILILCIMVFLIIIMLIVFRKLIKYLECIDSNKTNEREY